MSVRVVLKGDADLTQIGIPSSWKSRDWILHSKEYNISKSDLERIKMHLKKEKYNAKNPDRGRDQMFNFDDRFVESEWVRVGVKGGREGEFWNTSKLDLIQDERERELFVPENYLSMKEVQRNFGTWASRGKVERAGYEVVYGKKQGKQGRCGYFVAPDIMHHSPSMMDGLVPVRDVFSRFPALSKEDTATIVDLSQEPLKKKKVRDGPEVSRKDYVIQEDILVDLSANREITGKSLRSRKITAVNGMEETAKLRKLIRERKSKENN